jgi:uncharacterized DUF497 family protein
MKFEWDSRKAKRNFAKHRVSFEEATTVFLDPLSATGDDPDHSANEDRFITVGLSSSGRLLTVSHTERDDSIRIISARRSTKEEREVYEEK